MINPPGYEEEEKNLYLDHNFISRVRFQGKELVTFLMPRNKHY